MQEPQQEKKRDGRGGKRPGAGRPKIEGRSHMLHMPIPDELWDRLERYCKTTGMTKNSVVVGLLSTLPIYPCDE